MDLPPPFHLEGGGQLALDVVSPIARIDSAQRKPRHQMAGLVRKWQSKRTAFRNPFTATVERERGLQRSECPRTKWQRERGWPAWLCFSVDPRLLRPSCSRHRSTSRTPGGP